MMLRRDVYEADQRASDERRTAQQERIGKLEEGQTWAFRFILTEAVALIVALALTFLR